MLAQLKKMTRNEIEDSFDISGKKGKEGTTFLAEDEEGKEKYAVKLFKSTKSKAKLVLEAELQNLAARYGVAPVVHYVSEKQKFIVMDALEETIVDKGRRDEWTELPAEYAAQLYALCKRLDAAGVVQNDGNPLNLMLDGNGRLYIIDYGFAKKITQKIINKRGSQPNVDLTLWGFSSQLRHYGFANALEQVVNHYTKDNSFVDQELLDKGERLLGPIGATGPIKSEPEPAACDVEEELEPEDKEEPEELPFKSGDKVYWAKTDKKRFKVTVKSQTSSTEVTISYKTKSGAKTKVVAPDSLELITKVPRVENKKPVAKKKLVDAPPAPRKKHSIVKTPPRKKRKRVRELIPKKTSQFHQHVARPMTLEERIDARRKNK